MSLAAESTNANIGGAKERGKKNVVARLGNKITRDVIDICCAVGLHIRVVHNSVQRAVDCLPVDMEIDVSRIYKVKRRFGGTYRPYLQGQKICQARNKCESSLQAHVISQKIELFITTAV
jgi:hypothetical protein